jgi:hypothetical protein
LTLLVCCCRVCCSLMLMLMLTLLLTPPKKNKRENTKTRNNIKRARNKQAPLAPLGGASGAGFCPRPPCLDYLKNIAPRKHHYTARNRTFTIDTGTHKHRISLLFGPAQVKKKNPKYAISPSP